MSKESLKLAILEYEKDLETDKNNQWVKNVLKGLKKCEQDLDKLDQYKQLEKEIGIDLITLFKALRDGIFINEDGSVYKDCIKSIEHWSDGWGFISNDDYIEVLFKDYGISWALTEEEFYKNIK